MDTRKLIDELKTKNVHLYRSGDKLKYRASKGTLTEATKALLKQHKQELLKQLEDPKTIKIRGGSRASSLFQADCQLILERMPENTIDLIVTDPPYGYNFMGKDWDKDVPSVAIWKECLRVLKPGAFAFIMSAPRQDVLMQMITNLTAAGFKTDFTSLYWTYASGFPKKHNIGKAVYRKTGDKGNKFDGAYGGFQPKPAVEVIIVVQKPPTHPTQADQALDNGKGVTWLDDCRIPYADKSDAEQVYKNFTAGKNYNVGINWSETKKLGNGFNEKGRVPANLIVSDGVLGGSYSRYFSLDKWAECNLPFLIIPKPSKREKNFGCENKISYQVVQPRNGRDAVGCNAPRDGGGKERKDDHDTVKPLKLMAYLITMGSRHGDIVLDPFCGSGTTCLAANQMGRRSIGIELSPKYFEIAKSRHRASIMDSYCKPDRCMEKKKPTGVKSNDNVQGSKIS